MVDAPPDVAVESFAGVGNPFSLRDLAAGAGVVDIGSGAGLDSFATARFVGPSLHDVGVDMTPEMLGKARANAALLELGHVREHPHLPLTAHQPIGGCRCFRRPALPPAVLGKG